MYYLRPASLILIAAVTITTAVESSAHDEPADRFANVRIEAQHLAGSVHMLTGAGGNIGVSVGKDGTLIVDDQFAPLAAKISAALGELGGDQPKLVLNTHYHGDHTGSNPEFGRTGTIIAHDNVRVRLLDEDNFPRSGLPLVTFGNSINIHFNDEEIEVAHLPRGHTDGDSVVWFKTSNVIHMGDHYFKERFPFIDVNSGGSVDGFVRNVENVIAVIPEDIQIIPGHGSLSNVAELRATIDAVEQSAQQIRRALAEETKVSEIAEQIARDYASWASGFINAERWVQIVAADNEQR